MACTTSQRAMCLRDNPGACPIKCHDVRGKAKAAARLTMGRLYQDTLAGPRGEFAQDAYESALAADELGEWWQRGEGA